MHLRFLLIVVCAFLAGCATPYQKYGMMGGHFGYEVGTNQHQVVFVGNGYTPRATLYENFLHRCAEITVQRGYETFLIPDYDDFLILQEDETYWYPNERIRLLKGPAPANLPGAFEARKILDAPPGERGVAMPWRIPKRLPPEKVFTSAKAAKEQVATLVVPLGMVLVLVDGKRFYYPNRAVVGGTREVQLMPGTHRVRLIRLLQANEEAVFPRTDATVSFEAEANRSYRTKLGVDVQKLSFAVLQRIWIEDVTDGVGPTPTIPRMPRAGVATITSRGIRKLVEQLYSVDPGARVEAAHALSKKGRQAGPAIPYLISMVMDGTSVLNGRFCGKDLFNTGEQIYKTPGEIMTAVLQKLTDQKFGADEKAWTAWWEANRESWTGS